MALLTLINVSKTYHKETGMPVHAIQHVYLELLEGETVSIQGESNLGKATLLHIMACMEEPTSGQYYYGQHQIQFTWDEMRKIQNNKVCLISDTSELLPTETVYESIILPLLMEEMPLSTAYRKGLEVAKIVGLDHIFDQQVMHLSKLDRKRITLARALIHNPEILLVDDPTEGLEPHAAIRLIELFSILSEKYKKTIILTTSSDEIASRCQRNLKIEDGNISYCTPKDQTIESKKEQEVIA